MVTEGSLNKGAASAAGKEKVDYVGAAALALVHCSADQRQYLQ